MFSYAFTQGLILTSGFVTCIANVNPAALATRLFMSNRLEMSVFSEVSCA